MYKPRRRLHHDTLDNYGRWNIRPHEELDNARTLLRAYLTGEIIPPALTQNCIDRIEYLLAKGH